MKTENKSNFVSSHLAWLFLIVPLIAISAYALASFIIALVNQYYLCRSFYTLPGLISGVVVSALIILLALTFSLLVLIRHNSVKKSG